MPIELEQAKARYLGKSGALTELLKGLGKLPAAERPAMGARINAAKEQLEAALARAAREHRSAARSKPARAGSARRDAAGARHRHAAACIR